MKITIIGYGNMGKTYAKSFINSGVVAPHEIFVVSRKIPLILNNPIPFDNFSTEAKTFVGDCDVVVLAVKPQDFNELSKTLSGLFLEDCIVLSIMAGIKINTISKLTKATKIIRAMPNMASSIGMGMTVFTASESIAIDDLMTIQNLLNTTGKSLHVKDEKMIDAATAVSGSGPAYIFYFMDAMNKAAQHLGFSPSEAEILVSQTFLGAINLQIGSSLSEPELIAKVASKGGTTERALSVFESAKLNGIVVDAINAANQRAIELGS
ncbi:MAG: pyrroline-5-carboxylate reductase [Flavobacterium sp.]|uniref:pyrroline-5-carboxylate reductase n=1 Tax=Flavobacterium sp. TaxID=239 RepID=UPI00121D074B|nr:pyrroline-5-carboxylate reductase [Flavobacterium sp.]RZJ67427.1 MAG: pyrroline-5-carboxylate reductase [Flavobacterium sp.]